MHVSEPVHARCAPRLPLMAMRDRGAHMPQAKHPVSGVRQKRTLLECMSRRTVLRTLSFLSYHDIINLLCADKRLRPFVNMPAFAQWRKRYLKFRAIECKYERELRKESMPNTEVDDAFVKAYDEALQVLHFTSPPVHLHDVISCIFQSASEHVPPAHNACTFVIAWMLGRVPASAAFGHFDHAQAVELLYMLRLFFSVLRVSRLVTMSNLAYQQTMHVLDADCALALDTFFAPPRSSLFDGQLTEEQARFVHFQVRRNDLVCVQAYAGTGKTRSLLSYAKLRPQQRFLYITFNVAAARSARETFPPNVDCRTMHAVALKHVSIPENQELRALRPRDVLRLLADALPAGKRTKEPLNGRSNVLAPSTVALYVLRTLDRFMQSTDDKIRSDVHIPKSMLTSTDLSPERVAEAAQLLWDCIRLNTPRGRAKVPCPHDAYVKLFQLEPHAGVRFFGDYNALLLDEAQDLSACQTSILLRARGHCGVIVVGDVHQKIYGFRGGSATAFNARLYPPTASFQLTQSFRFGPQIAAVASKILQLKAPPPWHNEHEHGVWPRPRLTGHGIDTIQRDVEEVSHPHTRVYRTNALLTRDLLLLSATLPENKSLFLRTSQNLSHKAITELLRDGHKLYHGEVSSLAPHSPLREFGAWKELIEHVEAEDAAEGKLTLLLSLQEMIASPDFLERVQTLECKFCAREDEASIVLTTVHQAKGLEWDSVVVADDFSPTLDACIPSMRPQVANFNAQDELNHLYVALTRARRELVIPPCVLQWLIAIDGLFRYRLSEKKRASKCPTCHQASSLVQLCEPFVRSLQFDARVHTLGCLLCVRSQLTSDDDLHDFVRFVDECGVSTITGKLSRASIGRHEQKCKTPAKPQSKRARTERVTHDPESLWQLRDVPLSVRAQRYMNMLETRLQCVNMWLALERHWLTPSASRP